MPTFANAVVDAVNAGLVLRANRDRSDYPSLVRIGVGVLYLAGNSRVLARTLLALHYFTHSGNAMALLIRTCSAIP
jgi:hypothetical protein